jgi:hypothetical protein
MPKSNFWAASCPEHLTRRQEYQAIKVQPLTGDGTFAGISPAILVNIASSFAGSTLSAAIKLRISGSDNALRSVSSCPDVLIESSFGVLDKKRFASC